MGRRRLIAAGAIVAAPAPATAQPYPGKPEWAVVAKKAEVVAR